MKSMMSIYFILIQHCFQDPRRGQCCLGPRWMPNPFRTTLGAEPEAEGSNNAERRCA
jgi:hypothetical protein